MQLLWRGKIACLFLIKPLCRKVLLLKGVLVKNVWTCISTFISSKNAVIASSCIEKLSYVIKDCSRKAHTFRKREILIVNYVIHWRILQNISGNV